MIGNKIQIYSFGSAFTVILHDLDGNNTLPIDCMGG
nr:MAG TPA: hypothetical protein [Caudoviricetes sp.]